MKLRQLIQPDKEWLESSADIQSAAKPIVQPPPPPPDPEFLDWLEELL